MFAGACMVLMHAFRVCNNVIIIHVLDRVDQQNRGFYIAPLGPRFLHE